MFNTELFTDRLMLRPPRLEDAAMAFQRYASDPIVTHFLHRKIHRTVDETAAFLSQRINAIASSGGGRWAICLKGDDSIWGSIAASIDGHVADVGYLLSPQLWGKGLMTEALKAVVSELWNHDALWRIQATCHIDNLASARVLENCGFEREGLMRRLTVMPQISKIPQDCYLFALTRAS